MPEYLAPGVFVEETSFRQKTIEGVGTSTTGFVGPSRFGPVFEEPPLLTSFADFERIYGGIDRIKFDGQDASHNYIAQAVRAYFAEGGARLYVARVFNDIASDDDGIASLDLVSLTPSGSPPGGMQLKARYPGEAGNFTVSFLFKLGQNVLGKDVNNNDTLLGAGYRDVVFAGSGSPPGSGQFYWVESYFDSTNSRQSLRLRRNDPGSTDSSDAVELGSVTYVMPVTVSVSVSALGRFSNEMVWEDLALHPDHPNSLDKIFAANPSKRSTVLYTPLVIATDMKNGASIAEFLTGLGNVVDNSTVVSKLTSDTDLERTISKELTGGNDGQQPTATEYEGDESIDGKKSGLMSFEDLEDISIIAAPGSTHDYSNENGSYSESTVEAITRQLIIHCEKMRYRVAVLDSTDGQLLSDIRRVRGKIDTTRAALYYPWIKIFDPVTESEIINPPSGHIAGIYARNDIDRGVHKSPANEVIRLALGYELLLNKGQNEVLNPDGVNCLRFFEGRGFRVWGARTASSDPEWKYLNVRRYFAYLERSIERGTQWAVFENNGEVLWGNVRSTIEDFLFNEWKENRIAGVTTDEAYFVRCDRTTMSQSDLDNGRMICLIGVAALKPAEFVIFRIGQKTLNSQG